MEQKRIPHPSNRCALDGDVRSVTLDDKKFALYASSTSESNPAAAPKEGIHEMLALLRRNGGVFLLVYCMSAFQPIEWICEIHRTITSNSIPSQRIPAVAVIVGESDADQLEHWWSSAEDGLADRGPHFDDHTFIRMPLGGQSLTGDHISECRHALHILILPKVPVNSETDADIQRAAFYKLRSIRNSFQSLLVLPARKSSSCTSFGSKSIDIILLGEIGVGKSSLINLVAREDVAEVSSDTIGCTRTTTKYAVEERGQTFHLWDTPGLVDPQMGDKSFVEPIDIIQKLIHSLGNGKGPDLVLFCIDNLRPTTAFKRNYHIFHKFICSSKVPFALAVTKLEGDQGADKWWNQYGSSIRRYGINRSRFIGLGRQKKRLDSNADAEERWRDSLLSFFITCSDRQKNGPVSLRSSMERVSFFLRYRASTPERTLMKQYGLEEETARELANRLVSSKNQVHIEVLVRFQYSDFDTSLSIVIQYRDYATNVKMPLISGFASGNDYTMLNPGSKKICVVSKSTSVIENVAFASND